MSQLFASGDQSIEVSASSSVLPMNNFDTVCLVKAMVFPVVMYGCESWTVKKPEPQELMLLNCGVGEDS